MFSNDGDWILDLFSGTGMNLQYTLENYISIACQFVKVILLCFAIQLLVIGTTFACALKLFRNSVALEKDEEQVSFINMRIKALWEVGAKYIVEGERFQAASREPIPPLAGELGQLIELDGELLEDPTVANLTGEDGDTQNSEDSSQNEAEENDELMAMQYHL